MALDAQRNWTVSMAENLEQVVKKSNVAENEVSHDSSNRHVAEGDPVSIAGSISWTREHVHLPDEIVVEILDYVKLLENAQQSYVTCCLLSHQWYSVSVPYLYRNPHLYGKSFTPFIRTICPSINLHIRKSPLAELVKVLDMSRLVHHGSNSVTARLLGRTKNNLERFVAPTATFATNCMPALSKCHRLRYLDLSLVSESPPLADLLKAVANLEQLRTFRLPRSAGFGKAVRPTALLWPPNLENLGLSGGIDPHFLYNIVSFPQTLRSLTLAHCPLVTDDSIMHLLKTSAQHLPHLESLKLNNLPRLSRAALDEVLCLLPGLKRLSISVDYITHGLFDFPTLLRENSPAIDALDEFMVDLDDDALLTNHPAASLRPVYLKHQIALRCLELTHSGCSDVDDKVFPVHITQNILCGALRNLQQVRVPKSLRWANNHDLVEGPEDLMFALESAATARRFYGTDNAGEVETGVWIYDD